MQNGSKQLLSKLLCYRIDAATKQVLHFPGPARACFAHFARCGPYIQHELQCTLISQNIFLEDTPKSSPPEPENMPHAGSPPQKSSISSAPRRGHCQYSLFCPLHAHLQSEKPVHHSCCFQRGRYKIQFGSIHRVDSAGAGRNFHQELWGIHRKRARLHIIGLQRFNCF